MSRFAPALRRVARELDLPPSLRAAIILEMAADLDAIYEHHRRDGLGKEEARLRAEETVLGSPEMVRRLGQLHRGSWRSWSESVGARVGGGIDLLLLLGGVAPMFILVGVAMVQVLTRPVPVLVWPLAVVGVLMAGLVAVEGRRILLGGRRAGGGLPLLLVLSAVAPALGMLTLALGVHSTSLSFSMGMPEATAIEVLLADIAQDGALLLLGLLLGLAGALSWFILANRASVRAQRELDAVLDDGAGLSAELRSGGVLPLVRRRRA